MPPMTSCACRSRLLLMTDRIAMECVLEYVVLGNTAQLVDPTVISEFKSWIRFNGTDAVRTRDGLFGVSAGNPAIPAWLGDLAFGWFFIANGENDKIARQVRTSAGIAVFVGAAAVCSSFAAALGLAGLRSDLVVRLGGGPTLPRSLRRPVEAVMDSSLHTAPKSPFS